MENGFPKHNQRKNKTSYILLYWTSRWGFYDYNNSSLQLLGTIWSWPKHFFISDKKKNPSMTEYVLHNILKLWFQYKCFMSTVSTLIFLLGPSPL